MTTLKKNHSCNIQNKDGTNIWIWYETGIRYITDKTNNPFWDRKQQKKSKI